MISVAISGKRSEKAAPSAVETQCKPHKINTAHRNTRTLFYRLANAAVKRNDLSPISDDTISTNDSRLPEMKLYHSLDMTNSSSAGYSYVLLVEFVSFVRLVVSFTTT